MVVALQQAGLFTWGEWAIKLGAAITAAQAAGDPDRGDSYYHHWLAALEAIVAEKGIAGPALLDRYRHAWAHAAERTPHGKPIALTKDDFSA